MDDRTRWNEKYRAGRGPRWVNARLQQFLPRMRPGRVLDLAGGVGANARLFAGSLVVVADISDEALRLAPGSRVLADAVALPFAAGTFDSVVCTYFYEPRVDLAALLTPGGTLFLETFIVADAKYRAEFNSSHRFDPVRIPDLFRDLEVLSFHETDDGVRVWGTLLARKPDTV